MLRRNKYRSSKFATISSIWTKIYRYFGLAGDISSFKRIFYSILYAERSGRGFQLGNKTSAAKFATIYSIIPKIIRYFGTFWDISTFKRTSYSILDAECSAHYMQRRNKPSDSKFANIYPISPKTNRYFVTLWDISTCKRTFYSILDAECSAHHMQRRNKHSSSIFATISSILMKIYRYFGLARDISSFKRTFYSILYADRSGRGFQLGNKPSGAKFATIYSILSKINRYFGTFWDISTLKRKFYSSADAECSAHYMQGRNKHRSSKFATISSILTKIYRYFGLARDISSFKRTFYSILYADRSGRGFQLGNKPSGAKFATTYSI